MTESGDRKICPVRRRRMWRRGRRRMWRKGRRKRGRRKKGRRAAAQSKSAVK